MNIRPLSREEVRSIDAKAAQDLALPTLVLMENAGRGAAAWLRDRTAPPSRVLIACGSGNNGGDGGVVARHLDAWGFAVSVVWLAEASHLRGDAAAQWTILDKSGIDQINISGDVSSDLKGLEAQISDADWLIDALLGTGLTRPVEGTFYDAIAMFNQSGKPILALDLPSGLDADTGQPLGIAIRARATTTFVAPKLGFSAPGANQYTGEVAVVEIGVPRCVLEPFRAV